MMELLWFILAAYGLTYLVVYASIFNKIRPSKEWLGGLGKVFHCTLCFGWWASIFLFAINRWTGLFTFDYTIANFFICGFVGAGTSYILSVIVGDEGIKIDKGALK
jgi:hypothetical protein